MRKLGKKPKTLIAFTVFCVWSCLADPLKVVLSALTINVLKVILNLQENVDIFSVLGDIQIVLFPSFAYVSIFLCNFLPILPAASCMALEG